MAEAKSFKFGAQIDRMEYYRKNAKLGQLGTQRTSRDLLFLFWDFLHISGRAESRNFTFGVQIDRTEYYRKNATLGQIDTHRTSRDLLFNFGTASTSH